MGLIAFWLLFVQLSILCIWEPSTKKKQKFDLQNIDVQRFSKVLDSSGRLVGTISIDPGTSGTP